MGSYQPATTINVVLKNIHERKYLIPAIQRKYVWTTEQIESLFDSMMRGYPINSFMFWKIERDDIKRDLKFYEFLTKYREFYAENNEVIDVKANEFTAVIDGQQRLTSIYIGLKGSYAYKMPYKELKDDEKCIPTRYLYLDISKQLSISEDENADNERGMIYNFKFLSAKDLEKKSDDAIWFKVNDILNYEKLNDLVAYITKENLLTNDFARDTLFLLRKVVFDDNIINYYLEESQDMEQVLDIFIRTNSGGTKLSFSDLLMSITTNEWKNKDARKSMDELKKSVLNNCGFVINTDFVLKTCLFLFSEKSIKFQIKNFDDSLVRKFEENWDKVSASIVATFDLLKSWGFDEKGLTSKNAVIPIIYYIYKKEIADKINKPTYDNDEKTQIRKWLSLSLLKKVFGGQSDTILTVVRKVLEKEMGKKLFPLEEIKDAFKDNPTKNLSLTEEYIDSLLLTDMGDSYCYSILSLLYCHLDFNQTLHKDHIHPRSYFETELKKKVLDKGILDFYKKHYNSVLNLQLLNGLLNESKNASSLEDWVKKNNVNKKTQLIPEDVSLDIKDFEEFIKARKGLLKNRLIEIVGQCVEEADE